MRESYTLGPGEIQEAITNWLNTKDYIYTDKVSSDEVTVSFIHEDQVLQATEIEVSWGKPE